MRRRTARLLAVPLVLPPATAGVLLLAPPAQAHSGMLSSSPAEGERLEQAPSHVVLEFAAPVSASDASIRVVDGTGATRSEAVLLSHSRSVVSVLVADGGGAGVWQVRFEVRGQDGHVVAGGFDFGVDASAARGTAVLPVLPTTAGTVAALGVALVVLRRWAHRSAGPPA